MDIKVNKKTNRAYINGKECAIITDYDDKEFGHVLKCCTLKFKDYAVFFLIENNGKYARITNEEVFSKLVQKYETPASSNIVD